MTLDVSGMTSRYRGWRVARLRATPGASQRLRHTFLRPKSLQVHGRLMQCGVMMPLGMPVARWSRQAFKLRRPGFICTEAVSF